MPRQARLDAPGLLQHIMARGIERREIFKDDQDRQSFLERLAVIFEKTQTQCYAWALIPNHFHLLLRTGQTPLSKVMRRLMTGYAVTFNKRHKRSGHLFQNRYKSIVCEKDPYLLELIRYIHLNPLRAGLVKDLKELDRYPWAGHSAILGKKKNLLIPVLTADRRIAFSQFRPGTEKVTTNPENPACPVKFEDHFTGVNPACPACPVAPGDGTGVKNKPLAEKTIEDILLHFGDTIKVARRRYRQFVKEGVEQGTRPELQGGGLIRSAGGDKRNLLGRKKEEWELGDARILGSGDFVVQALKEADELHERSIKYSISLAELIEKVTHDIGIDIKELLSSKRKQEISNARAIISYLSAIELGYSGVKIAAALKLSEKSVSRCIDRGKRILGNDKQMYEYLYKVRR